MNLRYFIVTLGIVGIGALVFVAFLLGKQNNNDAMHSGSVESIPPDFTEGDRPSMFTIAPSRKEYNFTIFSVGAKGIVEGDFASVEFYGKLQGKIMPESEDGFFYSIGQLNQRGQWTTSLPAQFADELCFVGYDAHKRKQEEKCLNDVYSDEIYLLYRMNLADRVHGDLRMMSVALSAVVASEECTSFAIILGKPIVCGGSTFLTEVPRAQVGFVYHFPEIVNITDSQSIVLSASGYKDGGRLLCSMEECHCTEEGLCKY